MADPQTQTLSFKAETRQLLDLMVHSLYSHREIFLRELVSNASDALDKLRFEAVANPELLADQAELKVLLDIDADERRLTISDNGIGMSREEVVENIGTIAKSGTKELWEKLKQAKKDDQPEQMIGQFGVGFYSAFMVADRISLVTRRVGEESATSWESDGKGEFTIGDATRDHCGTTITLHLRPADEDADLADFADAGVVRRAVKDYSDFVRYPIELEGDVVNSMKAIWRKRPSEVTDDEYNEFYRHISLDWEPPQKRITVRAEGRLEYDALLYVPSRSPHDLLYNSFKWGPTLYVKNVRIMDHCEDLLPRYLRFVKGVVDSADLPLNVSREILQNHGQIRVVRKGLTRKILDALSTMQKEDSAEYASFWEQFGTVLKEGVAAFEQDSNKDKLTELLMFPTSHSDAEPTTLKAYVDRLQEGQTEIYYITAETKEIAANSPHLEAFRGRGLEILYLVDPIDEFVLQALSEYDGHALRSVAKGVPDLGADQADVDKQLEERAKEYSGVLLKLQKHLGSHIKEARLSARLTDSPVCLVGAETDMSPQLERLLRQGKQEVPAQQRILEINPDHPICEHMKALYRKDSAARVLDDYGDLLYGLALIGEGTLPPEPSKFTRLIANLMVGDVGPEQAAATTA